MQNGGPGGTASNGVTLGPVTFSDHNSVAVDSKAERVYVLCGDLCVRISSSKLIYHHADLGNTCPDWTMGLVWLDH
jgi:hypothetical protein